MMGKLSKILPLLTAISLCLLPSCGQSSNNPAASLPEALASGNEIGANTLGCKNRDPIVGTWRNKNGVFTEMEEWISLYRTCFSPDGQVTHYGNRNIDNGTWTRTDENTVTAYFDHCSYTGIGSGEYILPPYHVTYTYDEKEQALNRQTDRADHLTYYKAAWDGNVAVITGTDFDTYDKPLIRDSDDCTIEHSDYYPHYPKGPVYCTALEKALLSLANDLQAGKEVQLERADLPYELLNVSTYDLTGNGKPEIFAYVEMCNSFDSSGALYILTQKPDGKYTILSKNTDFNFSELLALDGTELLSLSIYGGSSSWKSGARVHISYREGQVAVDCDESYYFHWDYPLINYVNDYKNGKYYVYVSRENDTSGEGYGSYVDIGHSLKINEETFSPVLLPFTGYGASDTDYPALYHLWSPFDEDWWLDGGSYPEDEEQYGRTADWLPAAANAHPDKMLREAVERSGLELERKAYPWTPETRKNVSSLLRCPVADYYYQSDYYAAAYIRGEIFFYEKEILPDGYGEEWVPMQ